MTTFFYSLSIIFAVSEIFYLLNSRRIDLIFNKRDISDIGKKYVLYFFVKTMSYIWPILGLFSSYSLFFVSLVSVSALKFSSYHISRNAYSFIVLIQPFLNIILYLSIFFSMLYVEFF